MNGPTNPAANDNDAGPAVLILDAYSIGEGGSRMIVPAAVEELTQTFDIGSRVVIAPRKMAVHAWWPGWIIVPAAHNDGSDAFKSEPILRAIRAARRVFIAASSELIATVAPPLAEQGKKCAALLRDDSDVLRPLIRTGGLVALYYGALRAATLPLPPRIGMPMTPA
jgi:hypothetical protein